MDPATASSVAARARTENFPVASLLFPRALRPHLRAIYGFARLVDILGDEVRRRPARRARRARGAGRGLLRRRADLGGDARAAADDPRLLAAARAVPAADRGEPDGPARLGLRDLGRPEALLRPLGRSGRAARARRARARRRRGGGRALRRRLHRPAARQLPAGRAARPRARAGLPAGGGPAPLRRRGARPAEPGAAAAARVRGRAGARRCSRPARSSAGGSAAGASGARSRSSRAAGSRRSRRSSAPTGTSSTAGRGPRARGWRWR